MKIAWENRADGAAISTDSEISSLPASHVQVEHVGRKWRTDGDTAAYLILDMGASVACDIVALLGVNLTPTGTVRVRASDTDPTVVGSLLRDTGVLTGGAKAGYGAIYKAFTAATARYWRIDLDDAAAPGGYLEVGRVFLGPSWQTSEPQLFDWAPVVLDASVIGRSYGGQTYADQRPKRRGLMFVLDYMAEAEMYGNAFRLGWEQGITGDVLGIPDIDGSYLSEQAVFGQLQANEPLFHRLPQIYRQKFTLIERL
jgi:hypothetical protein